MAIIFSSAGRGSYSKRQSDGTTDSAVFCAACSNCAASVSESGGWDSGGAAYTAYVRSLQNICTTSSYNVVVTYDAFNAVGNRFIIQANDVDVYNSGCVIGSGSANVTIPAGTHKLLTQVDGACNGLPGDVWALTIVCAP